MFDHHILSALPATEFPAHPPPVTLTIPPPLHHSHSQSQTPSQTPSQPTPANFGRPRVRGLLKTARRSRQAASSDHTGSSPPTPPPIAHGDPWDRLRSFPHLQQQNRKRAWGDEREGRGESQSEREPWTSPDPFSEFDWDSDSSVASLSRHHHHHSHPNHHHLNPFHKDKRRREDLDDIFYDPDPDYSPPTSTDELDEEVVYWDYSRKCNPTSEKKQSMYNTRSKLMDTSSIGGSGTVPVGTNARSVAAAQLLQQEQNKNRQTADLDDWEFLKEMFANAALTYESKSHSKTIPLLRGVINECHRFMNLFHDPSVIYTSPLSSSSSPSSPGGRKPAKDRAEKIRKPKSVSASASISTPMATDTPVPSSPPPAASCCSTTNAPKEAEKKCVCKDLPTAFYTVLGTTLFFFGNIVETSPELCLPGEPSNPVVYWLAALDAFEIGENLPVRTNGRNFTTLEHVKVTDSVGRTSPSMRAGKSLSPGSSYQSDPGYTLSPTPEDWRMAIIWGRTLVSIAEELIRRQNEREKNPGFAAAQQAAEGNHQKTHELLVDALISRTISPQMPVAPAAPFAYAAPSYPFSVAAFFGGPRVPTNTVPNNNADTPSWPANSPLATLLSRRPHVPRRLSLDSGITPHQLLVLAQDQFSRGILHMPHPHQPSGGAKDKRPFLASRSGSMHCEGGGDASTPAIHSAAAASPQLRTFSRATELYTIAYEVLLLSEKLESAAERQQWAGWANNVFSQMKMEADTDVAKWRGLISGARGRCFMLVGTALAEGVEDRLEAAAKAAAKGKGKGAGEGESEAEILMSEDAIEAREALDEAVNYLDKAKDEFEAKMALEAQIVVEKPGEHEQDEDEDEDEEMILETDEEEEEEEHVPEDATPKPLPVSSTSVVNVIESPSSSSKATSSTAPPPPPPTATPALASAAKMVNTPEDEIEELKMLLAEVLVTLANLTADKRKREELYSRAQAVSGDKLMLDSSDEDDDSEMMDETY